MLNNNSRYDLNIFQAQANNFYSKVMPEMRETLGELIKRRMKDVGIKNNSELARLIKRSDAYVGDLINDTAKTKSGTYKPRPATLTALSKTLQIPESEILQAIGYISGDEKERLVQQVSTRIANNLLASGFNDLEDEDLISAVEADIASLAKNSVERMVNEQNRRKKK